MTKFEHPWAAPDVEIPAQRRSRNRLIAIPNMGMKPLQDIEDALAEIGLCVSDDWPPKETE